MCSCSCRVCSFSPLGPSRPAIDLLSFANCHTVGGPQKASKHRPHTRFFRLRRALSSVDARVDFDARARHVPHRSMRPRAAFFACRGSAGSLATAPRRKRHARACLPCTLHGSCAASHCAGVAAGKWISSHDPGRGDGRCAARHRCRSRPHSAAAMGAAYLHVVGALNIFLVEALAPAFTVVATM